MHFCNFLKKAFEIFQNFLASRGFPRTPYKTDPLKCPLPPNRNPRGTADYKIETYRLPVKLLNMLLNKIINRFIPKSRLLSKHELGI